MGGGVNKKHKIAGCAQKWAGERNQGTLIAENFLFFSWVLNSNLGRASCRSNCKTKSPSCDAANFLPDRRRFLILFPKKGYSKTKVVWRRGNKTPTKAGWGFVLWWRRWLCSSYVSLLFFLRLCVWPQPPRREMDFQVFISQVAACAFNPGEIRRRGKKLPKLSISFSSSGACLAMRGVCGKTRAERRGKRLLAWLIRFF